eukprot:Skav226615  [mRNA]  locus=scaffold2041:222073:223294:- [translate_table: standard]
MCLQERIVKAMGYRVVQVPHWHWNKIRHRKQRIEYIRMSRYYALKDRREMVPRDEELQELQGAAGREEFWALEVQDVAVNELDFLGEYFFRKDMPQTHFAWFQPRFLARCVSIRGCLHVEMLAWGREGKLFRGALCDRMIFGILSQASQYVVVATHCVRTFSVILPARFDQLL